MNMLLWPSIFFSLIIFNYEIHKHFEKKRNAIEDQFALEWNRLNIPNEYLEITK